MKRILYLATISGQICCEMTNIETQGTEITLTIVNRFDTTNDYNYKTTTMPCRTSHKIYPRGIFLHVLTELGLSVSKDLKENTTKRKINMYLIEEIMCKSSVQIMELIKDVKGTHDKDNFSRFSRSDSFK